MFAIKRICLSSIVAAFAFFLVVSTVEAETTSEVMTFRTLSCVLNEDGTTQIVRNSGPRTGRILNVRRLLVRARNQQANLRIRRLSLRQQMRSGVVNLIQTRRQLRRTRNRLRVVRDRRAFIRQCNRFELPDEEEKDEEENYPGKPDSTYAISIMLEGDGEGVVISEPSGINCGAGNLDCQAKFLENTQVTLSASPDSSSSFGSWESGDGLCSGQSSKCTIAVAQDIKIKALFESKGIPAEGIYVSPDGAGSRDGSNVSNAFSLQDALQDSAENPQSNRYYVLLDGIYTGFEDSISRTLQHRFVALNSGEAHFPEKIALTGTYFSLEGFSLDVYAGDSRDEYGVRLGGQHNQIRNCIIIGEGRYAASHPRAESVKISGSHNAIKYCDISEAISAIGGSGSNHLISGNNLHSTTAAPIRLHQLTNTIIENNKLHNSGRCAPMVAWCSDPDNNSMPEWNVAQYINGCNLSNCPNGGNTGYGGNAPHPNLLSARELDNVIIRGNMGWDGEIPTLRIRDGFGGGPNGENIIVENNIFPQFYGYSGELTVRNNIFGTAQFGTNSGSSSCSVKEFSLNIVGGFSYANTGSSCTDFEYKDYNFIQWKACRSGYSCAVGPNDEDMDAGWGIFSNWHDFFVDYQGINDASDFKLKSGSLPVDFGPLDRAAETDKAGNFRVEISGVGNSFPLIADAGVYEYQ